MKSLSWYFQIWFLYAATAGIQCRVHGGHLVNYSADLDSYSGSGGQITSEYGAGTTLEDDEDFEYSGDRSIASKNTIIFGGTEDKRGEDQNGPFGTITVPQIDDNKEVQQSSGGGTVIDGQYFEGRGGQTISKHGDGTLEDDEDFEYSGDRSIASKNTIIISGSEDKRGGDQNGAFGTITVPQIDDNKEVEQSSGGGTVTDGQDFEGRGGQTISKQGDGTLEDDEDFGYSGDRSTALKNTIVVSGTGDKLLDHSGDFASTKEHQIDDNEEVRYGGSGGGTVTDFGGSGDQSTSEHRNGGYKSELYASNRVTFVDSSTGDKRREDQNGTLGTVHQTDNNKEVEHRSGGDTIIDDQDFRGSGDQSTSEHSNGTLTDDEDFDYGGDHSIILSGTEEKRGEDGSGASDRVTFVDDEDTLQENLKTLDKAFFGHNDKSTQIGSFNSTTERQIDDSEEVGHSGSGSGTFTDDEDFGHSGSGNHVTYLEYGTSTIDNRAPKLNLKGTDSDIIFVDEGDLWHRSMQLHLDQGIDESEHSGSGHNSFVDDEEGSGDDRVSSGWLEGPI